MASANHGRIERVLDAITIVVASVVGLCMIAFCSWLLWRNLVDCATGPSPRLYPGASPTVTHESITAVIVTTLTTTTYDTTATLADVQQHYMQEFLRICEPGSQTTFVPIAPCDEGQMCLSAQCWSEGWNNGRGPFTSFPEGGYHYDTAHRIRLQLMEQRDGRVRVVQEEDVSTSC
jgi:hypothetical protein